MIDLSVLEAPRKRRCFKARSVEACQQLGSSIAGIALEHSLNANLVHKWIRAARQQSAVVEAPAFVPVPWPVPHRPLLPRNRRRTVFASQSRAPIEPVIIRWSASKADACRSLIRELLA